MRPALFLLPLSLLACNQEPLDGDDSRGLLGRGLLDPFPSIHLIDDAGQLAIPMGLLPEGDTPIPVDRLAWRTGFSPLQTAVVQLDGVDPAALPSWRSPTPGEGGVLLVDLDDGRFLSVMAELDAHPDAEDPALIVRPLVAMTPGHQVAVVVTTDAADRPQRFDRLVTGDAPDDFAHQARHYEELLDSLEDLGVEPDDVAIAWDFPIGEGTKPLTDALGQLVPPGTWSLPDEKVRDLDESERVSDLTWRAAEGTFTAQDFLVDDSLLDLNADGTVNQTGTVEAFLYVHIPTSVADAPAGSVPILIFGHGIFATPTDGLDMQAGYVSALTWLAEEQGFIVVSTRWRGLDSDDALGAIAAANDFGDLPVLTDRMVQGQVNTRTLVDLLVASDLLTDPVFEGRGGQLLADPDHIYFYGVSMGAILGGVLVANEAPIEASVLHVGAGGWSSLLERSVQWSSFERLLEDQVADPGDRQVLYAGSQLWWDAVDPISYVEGLSDEIVLLQENKGDEAVHNMCTRTLARSLGLPQLAPTISDVPGLDRVTGPLPPGSRALVQFDPGRGDATDTNRPSPSSGAHGATMTWDGNLAQIRDFFTEGKIGQIAHHCGEEACTRFNQGTLVE